MATEEELRQRYVVLLPQLTERQRRLLVAADQREEGRGGPSKVARAAGMSRQTIYDGLRELEAGSTLPTERSQQPGGGRKPVEVTQPCRWS